MIIDRKMSPQMCLAMIELQLPKSTPRGTPGLGSFCQGGEWAAVLKARD